MKTASFVVLIAMLAHTPPAAGQAPRPVRLSLAGGISRQAIETESRHDTGVHGQIGLLVSTPHLPFGVRVDLAAYRFDRSIENNFCLYAADARPGFCPDISSRAELWSGTLSAVVPLRKRGIVPYVLAGVGAYRRSVRTDAPQYGYCGIEGCGAPCPACTFIRADPSQQTSLVRETDFGASGGVGISFDVGRVALFTELRYHRLLSDQRDASVLPLTVGVTF